MKLLVLEDKPGNISFSNGEVTEDRNLLTPAEKDSLVKLRQEMNVYMIAKIENGIYYGLSGNSHPYPTWLIQITGF